MRIALLLMLLTSVGFSRADGIIGQWMRKVDLSDDNPDFFGNVIEIFYNGQSCSGKLVSVTDDTYQYGYSPGDIKWKDIVQLDNKTYLFKGLLIRTDLSAAFNNSIYIDCKLTILDENNIRIEAYSDAYDFVGKYQIWERLNPS